jgi:hypothetical protein
MYEGFELVEEEVIDFVVINKEKPVTTTPPKPIIHHDYEKLLHRNKIMTTQLTNIVNELDKAGVAGNNRDLWLAAANCVIKCMVDVICEGEKMLKDKSTEKT